MGKTFYILEEKYGIIAFLPSVRKIFHKWNERPYNKRKLTNFDYFHFKNSFFPKTLLRLQKDKPQTGRAAMFTTSKGLLSKIHEEILENNKKNNPIEKSTCIRKDAPLH